MKEETKNNERRVTRSTDLDDYEFLKDFQQNSENGQDDFEDDYEAEDNSTSVEGKSEDYPNNDVEGGFAIEDCDDYEDEAEYKLTSVTGESTDYPKNNVEGDFDIEDCDDYEEGNAEGDDDEEDEKKVLPFWLLVLLLVLPVTFGAIFLIKFVNHGDDKDTNLSMSETIETYEPESEEEVENETEYVTQVETEPETDSSSETSGETDISPQILAILAKKGIGLTVEEAKTELVKEPQLTTTANQPKPSISKPTTSQQPKPSISQPTTPQKPKPTEPPKENPPEEDSPKEDSEKKEAIVRILSQTSEYGEKIKDPDFSIESKNITKDEMKKYLNMEKDKGENVGTYKIKGSCNKKDWNVTIYDGTYKITQRNLLIKIDDKQSIEGEQLEDLSFIVKSGSIVNDDKVVSLSTDAKSAVVGEFPINVEIINANYLVQIDGNAIYRVKPAPHIPKDDDEVVEGPGSENPPSGPSDPTDEVTPDNPTPSEPKDEEEGDFSDDTSSGPSDPTDEVTPDNPTPSEPKEEEEGNFFDDTSSGPSDLDEEIEPDIATPTQD